jgi:phospholipid/cholesterol/gamma-HCH transport system substrate-binding protein
VSSFVKENRDVLGRNITGLNRVSKVLVKRRGELDQILDSAPLALNNLALTYNPQAGTLDTRANQGQLGQQIGADPAAFLCSIVGQADQSGEACNQIEEALPALQQALPLPRTGTFGARGPQPWQDRFDPSLGGLVEVSR